MAIQVSEQVENQAELKGALSTRSKLAVDSKKFTSQVISLGSAIAISQDTDQFVSEIRQLASDRLASLSFPTTKDEEWKYTDVSSLGNLTFASCLPQKILSSKTQSSFCLYLHHRLAQH